ncbi:peptidoglycan-binding protein LysM [Jannaschia sp. AI_61]|nr:MULTISPECIES: LysM peptidoglycan-binding domain-containing protein [unclassified Jannaschia]GIT92059.1 peptidoglycan-binding protein LysM [Jannaschia sp. AI_61]
MSNALWPVFAFVGVAAVGMAGFAVRLSQDDGDRSADLPSGDGPAETPIVAGAGTVPTPAPQPQQTPTAPETADVPQMDIVRVDAAGATVIAGSGPAASDVTLRLDGAEVATARTDASGNFVSLFDLPTLEAPGVLTLEVADAEGSVTQADDSVIIAPTAPLPPALDEPVTATEDVAEAEAAPVAAPNETQQVKEVEAPGPGPQAIAQAPEPPRSPSSHGSAPALTLQGEAGTERLSTPQEPFAEAPASSPVAAPQPQPTDDVARPTPAAPGVEATTPSNIQVAAAPPSAPIAPRLFRAGPSGVSLLTEAPASPPEAVVDLGIDAISYDDDGDVRLTGRAAQDSELRIYLDNRPVQTVQVDRTGAWSSVLPDVDTGVYTLRVDAVAEDGAVEERVETPFQRTAPEIAAQLRRDGATAITVQPGYTLWAISEGYFGNGVQYVQLFEANRSLIRDPDLIYPGQVFALPAND